jgi:hypothetical protein
MNKIYYPPESFRYTGNYRSAFLAGTIDNGNSEDWQKEMGEFFLDLGMDVFNPRRKDWDSSWIPAKENKQFKEQVEWELRHLHKADIALFYFLPNSKSPVTMLELGLALAANLIWRKIFVYCPKEFWRKGNIDLTCERFGVKVYEDLEKLKKDITKYEKTAKLN